MTNSVGQTLSALWKDECPFVMKLVYSDCGDCFHGDCARCTTIATTAEVVNGKLPAKHTPEFLPHNDCYVFHLVFPIKRDSFDVNRQTEVQLRILLEKQNKK